MSMTAAQILMILQGDAPAELKERFLQEADDPQSHVRATLIAVEKWAKAELNTNCPSPDIADDGGQSAIPIPTYRVVRKAALWDDEEKQATPADLVDYIRGLAKPEAIELVKKALTDPASKLSEILNRMTEKEK
ncbi:MAG: hypothetical protein ABSH22_08095 [Tepidisphaeraceae bacterium]